MKGAVIDEIESHYDAMTEAHFVRTRGRVPYEELVGVRRQSVFEIMHGEIASALAHDPGFRGSLLAYAQGWAAGATMRALLGLT